MISVKIIQPIRADAGRGKRHRTFLAELCKNVLADVLISKCHEFLNEVLLELVQPAVSLAQAHTVKQDAVKDFCLCRNRLEKHELSHLWPRILRSNQDKSLQI